MLSHFYTGARSSNCSSYISCTITPQLIHNSGRHYSSHSNVSQPWPDGFNQQFACCACGSLLLLYIGFNSALSRAQPLEAAQRRAQPLNAAQIRARACPAGAHTVCRWRLRAPALDMRSRARRKQPPNTVPSRSTPFRAAQRRSTPLAVAHGVNSRVHALPGGSGNVMHVVSACYWCHYVKPATAMRSRAERLQDAALCALPGLLQLAAPAAGKAQQARREHTRGAHRASWTAAARCWKFAGPGPAEMRHACPAPLATSPQCLQGPGCASSRVLPGAPRRKPLQAGRAQACMRPPIELRAPQIRSNQQPPQLDIRPTARAPPQQIYTSTAAAAPVARPFAKLA